MLLERLERHSGDLRWKLCLKRQLALELGAGQVVPPDKDLDGSRRQFVNTQFVADILRKFQNDLPYFLIIQQIGNARDTVTDGFHRGHETLLHDP